MRWGNRWRPPENKTAKARLLPGDYTCIDGNNYEYYQYVEFYSARTKKSFISSGKWGFDEEGNLQLIGGTCLGQQELQREIDDGVPRDKRTVSRRLMQVFNLIHLDWYHLVPVFDEKTGKPILYKGGDRKGDQVHRKELCEGRRCEFCKDKLEKVFGKKCHWSMGNGHLGHLVGVMDEIGKDCANCGSGGSVSTVSFECSKCAHPFIDMAQTELTDEQIYARSGDIRECPECNNKDLMLEQIECGNCQDPVRLSLFDVDIEVKRQGKGTDSTVIVPRWHITEMSEDLVKMAKPWPFKRIFSGDPLDIQAKYLRIRAPGGAGGNAEDHAGDYEDEPDYED